MPGVKFPKCKWLFNSKNKLFIQMRLRLRFSATNIPGLKDQYIHCYLGCKICDCVGLLPFYTIWELFLEYFRKTPDGICTKTENGLGFQQENDSKQIAKNGSPVRT